MIAEIFHEIHWIEKWGRGISLILSKEPDADFKEIGTQFIVTFKRKYLEDEEGVGEKVGGKEVEREVEKEVEKESEWELEGLTDSQKAILKMIKANPYTSKKEMSENIGIRISSIDKNIQTLKKKGLLKRIGPAKGGHWEVLEK